MKNKNYLCTRPALAAHLMDAGYTGLERNNPFDTDGTHSRAWLFDLTQDLAEEVAAYCHETGSTVPRSIAAMTEGK